MLVCLIDLTVLFTVISILFLAARNTSVAAASFFPTNSIGKVNEVEVEPVLNILDC